MDWRKKSWVLGLVLGVILLGFSPLHAQTVKKYTVVKVSAANIRSAPSKSGSILYVARMGEKLELLEDLGTWLRVKTKGGIVGFIYSSLVQVEIEKILPPAEQPPSQQPKPPSVQPPTPPPSGARTTVSQKRSLLPFYIVGGLAVAGATAYFLFRKGGLLNKGTATLHVNSTPSEAKVYVDDEEKCETPCTVEKVSPGTHTIKVVRELYGKWSREMELKGYQEYDINATLAPYGYEADFCFGSHGSGNGQFKAPWDLTVDDDGNIYVADTWNNRLQKFDSSGNFILKVDTIPPGGFPLWPSGIAFSSSNNRIYVVFDNDPALNWYNLNLGWISNHGLSLINPRSLGIDSSGNIYIADAGHYRIVKTDADGNYQGEWTTGSGSWPTEAAPYEDNVYVALCGNDKVKIYSLSGAEKGEFSKTMDCPAGITVDKMGHVYVAAYYEDKVYKFMSDGEVILHFGSHGSGRKNFDMPVGIEVLENGDVLVADESNHRICKWRMTEETISTARAKITVKRKRRGGFYQGRRKFMLKAGAFPKRIKERRKIRK